MAINFANRLSAITTDSAGTTHLVWVENAAIWHAVYDDNAGTWQDAQAIAEVGAESITSLSLVANDKLIGGSAPGLAVVYQQGSDNDSDFFYTAAQYNTSGKLQWLASPQNLSADQVGDLEPRAIANNDGTVFVVGQKVNTDNANNFSSREDTDLYYQSFTVSSSQFPTPTPPPVNTNNAVYTSQILASPLANPKRKPNTKVFQGSGFNWNGSQYFDTNLLEFNLLNQSPSQPNGYLGNLFKRINIAGSLQAASGGKNPELTLINGVNGPLLNVAASVSYQNTNAQGKDFQGNFGPSNYFSASANFSTLYNYALTPNSQGYYPLANQKGTMGVSFGLKIPLYQEPPFFINFLGSAGASFQWQLSPSASDPNYTSILSPYLAPNSSGSDAILTASIGILPAGAVEAIALALLSDITEIIRRSDGDLKLDGLDVSIPVAAGLAGGINIPLLFQAILSGQVYVQGKFSFAQSTPDQGALTLGLPVRLTVKTLGFLGGTLEYFPEWKWAWNLGSSSSTAPSLLSANPSTSSTTTASVQGSLLTITFPNALANNLALNPDDFTVTVTDVNGLISFISVFGLIVQENTNSVILRLEQTIPYISHNSDVSPANNIQVSYNGTAPLDFGDGPLTVTNNSSQNFVYTYNPTGGTDDDYTGTSNQLVINFNTELNPQIIPDVSQFTIENSDVTVTSVLGVTNQSVALQLSDPIAGAFTVSYQANAQGLQLQDRNNNPLPSFTFDSSDTSNKGLVNSLFSNSVATTNVIAQITTDFAQDQTPALALTSSNNILMAWSSDAPPLAPISAVVNPDNSSQIYINFFVSNSDEVLGGSPSPQQFQVFVNGNPNTVTNIGDPAVGTITLNLASPINQGDTVTVCYELNNGSADNLFLTDVTDTMLWIPAFENVTVTNNSGSASQPLAAVATLTTYQGNIATALTFTFAQNVDASSLDLSQFFIYKNGNLIAVEPNYAVSQNLLSLILGEPVRQGDLISVFYTPNANLEGGLKDSNGVLLNGFEVQQVITTPAVASTVIKTTTNDSNAKLESIPGTGDGIDFDPAAIEFNGQNIVAWVHVDSSDFNNQAIPGRIYSEEDTAQINQALGASDIYYSIYNPTLGLWSVAAPIAPSQTGQDQKVALGIGPHGQLMAAWLNTQTINGNGEIKTSIYLSSFDSTTTTWSTPQKLLSEISPDAFTELSISSLNGQPAIFWTESQPSSYSNLVFAANPLVYLRLGELSGTTAFNSGQLGINGNGTYQSTGNFTLNQTGALNPFLPLDGSGLNLTEALEGDATLAGDPNPAVLFSNGGGVTLDAAIPLSAQGFSVELWFKVPTLPSQSLNLLSMLPETGTTPIFNLALNDSTLTFDLAAEIVNTQATNIEANTWNYLVGSYDSAKKTLSLYLNGTLLGTPTTVATNPLPTGTAGQLSLAGGSGSVYLDEVAFYNAPLSQTASSSLEMTADNFMNVTGSQILDQSFSVNQISDRYNAQYNDPVPSGPEAHYSVWNPASNNWQTPSQIDPIAEIVPTVLADANNPIWDIVSANIAQDNTNIFPNGNPDTIFQIAVTLLSTYKSRDIVGISVTNNNQTWSVGQDGKDNFLGGNQLGVILGGVNGQLNFTEGATLLNSNNPTSSTFRHRMMSGTETLTLFVDAGNATPPTSADIQVFFQDGSSSSFKATPLPNQGGPVTTNNPEYLGTQVLGIATITEANDSSLSLIDSGFVINTDNTAIATVLAKGFNKGQSGKAQLAYVAVGNRGYTNSSGQVINGGTVQILLAGEDVLTNQETNPLTTTDLSGNTNGILMTGITDNGSANNHVAMSLATGDLDGDGIDDLVIGDANANNGQGAIYVIYGSYLTNHPNSTIDVTNLTSAQGYALTIPIPANNTDTFLAQVGFSVVVGNFDGDSSYTRNDIAFGAFGWGGVYVAYNGGSPEQIDYFPLNLPGAPSEGVGFSLGVSHYSLNGPLTFTGHKSDDLFITAPGYRQEITNQWSGRAGLPSGNQGDYPDSSEVAIGAVYVFSSSSNQLSANPVATYTGPTIPDTNGVAANYFAGTAIASEDLDGDGQQDLAISAPGVNGNSGAVYVINGKTALFPLIPPQSTSSSQLIPPIPLNTTSNLIINGGIPSGKVGTILSPAGDINGDRYQDFLITAPQVVNGTGQSYLLFGGSDFFANPTLDLSNTANNGNNLFLLNGSLPYQLAGTAAIGAGDINSDGVDDLLLSAPNAQQLYAVYGHPWLAADGSIKLADIASDNGFIIDGSRFNTFNVINANIPNQETPLTPALVNYQNTLYMAYKGLTNNNIYLTTSQDGGKTWTDGNGNPGAAVIIENATTLSPSLVVFEDTLYLAYQNPTNNEINLYWSSDGVQWNSYGEGLSVIFNPNFSPGYKDENFTTQATPTLVVFQGQLMIIFPAPGNDYPNVAEGTYLYTYTTNPQDFNGWSGQTAITYGGGNTAITGGTISAAVMDDANSDNSTLYLIAQGGGSSQNLYLVSATANANSNLSQLPWNATEILPHLTTEQAPTLTTDGETLYLTNTTSVVDSNQLLYLSTSSNGVGWTTWALPGDPNNINYAPATTILNDQLYVVRSGANLGYEVLNSPLPLVGNIINNGSLVCLLGDINGDGFADVFSGGNQTGAIIFGKSTNALLDAAIATDDLIITVANANLKNVISLGDFNGDSFKDFGVLDSNDTFYVFLGGTALGNGGQFIVTTALPNIAAVTQASTVGDYNGDGYDDVLLSFGDTGSWVYLGNQTGTLNTNNPLELPVPSIPTSTGTGVDLNGDGYNEIAAGAGISSLPGTVSTSGSFGLYENLPLTNLTFLDTQSVANQLQAIGDFNGDGIEDLAVLASNYYAATLGEPVGLNQVGNQGGVFIYYGTPNGLTSNSSPNVILAAPFSILSGQQSPFYLSKIAQAGDVNGDGFDDLLISSPFTLTQPSPNSRDTQGSVFVVFGGNNWNSTPFDLGLLSANQVPQGSSAQGFLIEGLPNAQAGIAISGGEDINGDGFDDLAIGAPGRYESQLSQNTVIGDDKGRIWYKGQQINNGSNDPAVISMVVQENASGGVSQIVVGLVNGEVWWYNGSSWSQLNSSNVVNNWASPINTLSVQWNEQGQPPQVIVGLGQDGGVFLFTGDSDNWSTLIDGAEGSPVTQMAVNWQENPPQVVVGYQDGTVAYSVDYDNTQNINNFPQPSSWNSSIPITQMAVNWQENGDPQIVIGLGDKGGVEYYDGSNWYILENLSPAWSSSVNQMAVQWNTQGQPQIVVGLNDGAILYYNGSGGFGSLPGGGVAPSPVTQMAVQWNADGDPQIVAALGDKGGVEYYNGSQWTTVADSNPGWSSPVTQMSVQWGSDGQPDIVVGLQNGTAIALPYNGSGWDQNTIAGVGTGINQLTSLWSEPIVNSGNGDNLNYVLFGDDFNDTVNQTGTIGDDVMLGTATGESFVAGLGNDQIYSQGGLDVVYAGPGDDLVTVSDTYFRRLDGGTGLDTLQLTGYTNQSWDLTTLAPGVRLQDFETLDIRNYGANQLTINSVTVMDLSSDNILTILMDSEDSLVLSPDFNVLPVTIVYQDGQNYYQYTTRTSAAKVLVNRAITPTYTALMVNEPKTILPAGNTTMSATSANNPSQNNFPVPSASNPNAPTQLFVDNPRASEATGKVNFTIQRTGDLSKYALVSYLTQDGDGKAGNRYLPVAGRLLFNPGETTKTVTVAIPNDGIYTGDRQFGLLVSLLEEGLDPTPWPTTLNLSGNAYGEQIRRWNYTEGNTDNGVMNGILDFSTTVTNGQAQVNLSSQNLDDFNDFFNYNPVTNQYESLMVQDNLGAKFTYSETNPQDSPDGTELTLKDGDLGDADGVTNGLVKTQGYIGRTTPGLIMSKNQTFWAPTKADGQVQWRLINSPNHDYELGWIPVDDQQGTINGLTPTDAGYEAAALARKQIIFQNNRSASHQALTSTLAQQSFLDPKSLASTERQFFGEFSFFNLQPNRFYMLYSQEGTETTFSVNNLSDVQNDSRGYHQLTFNGITVEIGSSTLVTPGNLNEPISVATSLSRAGAYENIIAFYQVDSLTGGLDTNGDRQIDLQPGDEGYTQAALTRTKDALTGTTLITPEYLGTMQQNITLLGNTMYGMVIIPNATIEQVLIQNPDNNPSLGPVALFSFGAANPDGLSHMARLGANLFGFEDLVGGGDRDYNDMILQLTPSALTVSA